MRQQKGFRLESAFETISAALKSAQCQPSLGQQAGTALDALAALEDHLGDMHPSCPFYEEWPEDWQGSFGPPGSHNSWRESLPHQRAGAALLRGYHDRVPLIR